MELYRSTSSYLSPSSELFNASFLSLSLSSLSFSRCFSSSAKSPSSSPWSKTLHTSRMSLTSRSGPAFPKSNAVTVMGPINDGLCASASWALRRAIRDSDSWSVADSSGCDRSDQLMSSDMAGVDWGVCIYYYYWRGRSMEHVAAGRDGVMAEAGDWELAGNVSRKGKFDSSPVVGGCAAPSLGLFIPRLAQNTGHCICKVYTYRLATRIAAAQTSPAPAQQRTRPLCIAPPPSSIPRPRSFHSSTLPPSAIFHEILDVSRHFSLVHNRLCGDTVAAARTVRSCLASYTVIITPYYMLR